MLKYGDLRNGRAGILAEDSIKAAHIINAMEGKNVINTRRLNRNIFQSFFSSTFETPQFGRFHRT